MDVWDHPTADEKLLLARSLSALRTRLASGKRLPIVPETECVKQSRRQRCYGRCLAHLVKIEVCMWLRHSDTILWCMAALKAFSFETQLYPDDNGNSLRVYTWNITSHEIFFSTCYLNSINPPFKYTTFFCWQPPYLPTILTTCWRSTSSWRPSYLLHPYSPSHYHSLPQSLTPFI